MNERIRPMVRKESIDKLEAVFDSATMTNPLNAKQIIENRKYLLAYLLEMYSTWHEKGDCLPSYVQLGFGGPMLHLVIEGDKQA